jgi:hypothetical protein
MYRHAAPTRKISKPTRAEIREIHRTLPVKLLFLWENAMSTDPAAILAMNAPKHGAVAKETHWGERMVRMSSGLAASSAVTLLSAALVCGPSGTARSQSQLPSVTVEAPKQVTRPQRPEVTSRGSGRLVHRGRASRSTQTIGGGTPSAAQGPIMAKLARLEREASSCNDGCESSFPHGKDPWVGCSESVGYYSVFSATCKDTLTHRDYVQCVETKMFLGWDRNRSWWYCTGMLAGGKFRLTAENRNR